MLSGMERTDPAVKALRPRLWGPHQVLADETFVDRVKAMELSPWEVITSNELARCADITPRTLADWRRCYIGVIHLPEPEPVGRYPGKSLYYRVDALLDWHSGQGERAVQWDRLWEQGAAALEQMNLARPQGPEATSAMVKWLHDKAVLHRRIEPKVLQLRIYGDAAG